MVRRVRPLASLAHHLSRGEPSRASEARRGSEYGYVYIIECEDSSLYAGITQNLFRRFGERKSGKGGCYTRHNRAEKILYSEPFANERSAKEGEAQIKKWSNAKKRALIEGDFEKLRQLSISKD